MHTACLLNIPMLSSRGVPDAKMYLYPKEKNQKKYKKLETIKVFSHHQKSR